jgi:hypothetical protein
MKYFYYTALFLLLIYVISCSGSKYTPAALKTGEYSFSMSDSSGNTLVEGEMKLDTNADGIIYGTYNFTNKYVTNFPGFSTMTGSCEGTYVRSEGLVHLNMNPKVADANVFIGAKIYRSSLAGEWSFSTFRGVKTIGKFVAKIKE